MPDNKTEPKQQSKHCQTRYTDTNHDQHNIILLSEENIIRGSLEIMRGRGTTGVWPFRVANVAQFEDVVGWGAGVTWKLGQLVVNAYV